MQGVAFKFEALLFKKMLNRLSSYRSQDGAVVGAGCEVWQGLEAGTHARGNTRLKMIQHAIEPCREVGTQRRTDLKGLYS